SAGSGRRTGRGAAARGRRRRLRRRSRGEPSSLRADGDVGGCEVHDRGTSRRPDRSRSRREQRNPRRRGARRRRDDQVPRLERRRSETGQPRRQDDRRYGERSGAAHQSVAGCTGVTRVPGREKQSQVRVLLKSVPLVFALGVVAGAQMANIAEQDPINYSKSSPADSVAQLQQKIDSGAVTLEFDAQHGWLPSVLKALHVPVSSQGLVFSRTSLQVDRIAPWTPRAIYFNDDVYVGWVQGGPIMEIASADPQLGGVFYTLSQEKSDHPKFERQTHTCLQCHDSSSSTGGVPGFIMRSVVTDRYGYPVASDLGATTDATPMEKRWGGWYVTGTMGDPPHMGNVFVPKLAHEIGNMQSYLSQNKVVSAHDVTSLKDRFDVDPYLAPDSDAVALLVLAHQTYVHNLITRAGYEARISGERLDPRAKGAAERLVSGLVMAKQ